jgi:hypothetical protein
MNPPLQRTRVRLASERRNWTVGVGVASLLGYGALVYYVPFAVVAGLIVVPMLGASIISAWRESCEGACPGCAARLESLRPADNDGVCCKDCGRYSEGSNGELWLTSMDRIADEPLFGAPMFENVVFPSCCCVCLAAATREQEVGIQVVHRSTAGFKERKHFRYLVPYCADHRNAVVMRPTSPFVVIFRSYPYLRMYCEANGVRPVNTQSWSRSAASS